MSEASKSASSPHFTNQIYVIWFTCLGGILLQYVLQSYDIIGNHRTFDSSPLSLEQGNVAFGLLICIVAIIFHFTAKKQFAIFTKSRSFSFVLMVTLALLTAFGTFIKPSTAKVTILTDIYHSFPYTGCLGLLGAGLIVGLWQTRNNLKRLKGMATVAIHIGGIIFLAGTAITSVFRTEGLLYLHEGESASAYELFYHNLPTGKTILLPEAIKLIEFTVERHPEQFYLRVYSSDKQKKFELVESFPVKKGTVFTFGKNNKGKVEVTGFVPEFYIRKKSPPDSVDEDSTTTDSIKISVVELIIDYKGKTNLPALKLRQAGKIWLSAEEPELVPLGNNRYLSFEKSSEPKLFKSIVESNGILHKVIVNHPMKIGNHKIYQVDYSEKDKTLSGFQIVTDPGEGMVKSGLAVLLCGILLFLFSVAKHKNITE